MFKDDDIVIVDVDDNCFLFNKITESINSGDLFICDIALDYNDNWKTYINFNVMFELCHAIKNVNINNIILLLDTQNSSREQILSLLNNLYIMEYQHDNNDDEYIIDIRQKIIDTIEKEYVSNDLSTFEYFISHIF